MLVSDVFGIFEQLIKSFTNPRTQRVVTKVLEVILSAVYTDEGSDEVRVHTPNVPAHIGDDGAQNLGWGWCHMHFVLARWSLNFAQLWDSTGKLCHGLRRCKCGGRMVLESR